MTLNFGEKFTSNVDILLQVFNLLDLEDQFRLSRVSSQMKEVFETFIWRQRYTKLRVIIRPPYFVISNEANMNRVYLDNRQFKEFQISYAADVEDLTIKVAVPAPIPYDNWGFGSHGGELGMQQRSSLNLEQLDLRLFRHVTKLSCHHMLVELSYLKLIADCCPKLKELNLIKFDHVFAYGDFIRSLQRMSNLKVLVMKTFLPFPMEFKDFENLVATNKLEQLQLNYNIDLSNMMVDSQQAITLPTGLKDLKLWTNCDTGSCHWLQSFSAYLGTFTYLSSLYIKLSSSLNDESLTTIAKNCKQLEKLSFKCVKFEALQSFVVPPRLTDLTLNWCAGLTCNNLRQILTQLKLRKLCSKHTNYVGEYDFRVSPHMLSLDIDGISTHHFKPACDNNVNLQELAWYQHESPYDMDAGAALAAWVNLQTLHIRDCDVTFNTIHHLTNLKRVIMPCRAPRITWPFIKELLSHPSLDHLTLRYPDIADVMNKDYSTNDELENEGDIVNTENLNSGAEFKVNPRRLELSLEVFHQGAEFWLNIFRQSNKLTEMFLICQVCENIEFTLKYLMCKLPRSTQTIDVCGITISCKHFRTNFNEAMATLQCQIDDTDLWNDDETFYIKLHRSY